MRWYAGLLLCLIASQQEGSGLSLDNDSFSEGFTRFPMFVWVSLSQLGSPFIHKHELKFTKAFFPSLSGLIIGFLSISFKHIKY